ncbi:transcriptional regulator [Tardiphaga robiniae]|uniref:Transcriptional regulator n=1 Tax=Tardiphaga robiniae TaxID=943830 RepID=A0A161QLC2_9BRAD|nr:transcriptional regulator [Tardiphaga robiniae]
MPRAAKGRTTTSPKTYHHGDLRRVLIAAALELAEEGGADAVSVREAARRAGVSPGAPFRHFPSRNDLMSAVAEEAQRRFRVSIAAAIAGTSADDPLARFRAFGMAYMRWAMTNPAHFEVISSGKYFSHDQSEALREDNDELIAMTEQLLMDALAQGQLRSSDLRVIKIAGRALVYGFARMKIDGHFPRWGVADAEADQMAEAIITLFVDGIAKPV